MKSVLMSCETVPAGLDPSPRPSGGVQARAGSRTPGRRVAREVDLAVGPAFLADERDEYTAIAAGFDELLTAAFDDDDVLMKR